MVTVSSPFTTSGNEATELQEANLPAWGLDCRVKLAGSNPVMLVGQVITIFVPTDLIVNWGGGNDKAYTVPLPEPP